MSSKERDRKEGAATAGGTRPPRVPRQVRSQARHEAILAVALRLIAERGYEAVSMREIAREAGLPIASLYEYFPTRLAIVQEVWRRYTGAVHARLADQLAACTTATGAQVPAVIEGVIDGVIDLMVEMQAQQPGFLEIWGCVMAAPELRALNAADTLATARAVAAALALGAPGSGEEQWLGRALVLCESASAITRLALARPEPERPAMIAGLKRTLHDITLAGLRA